MAREKIITCAKRLFEKSGLEALSMRKVAREVGVTPMALYRHFDGKEALVDAIAEHGFELLAKRLERVGRSQSPVETIREVFQRYIQFALDEPSYYRLMFELERPAQRVYPRDFYEAPSRAFASLSEALRCGIECGELQEHDPVQAAVGLWATAHGLIALRRVGRFGASRRVFVELCRRTLDTELRGLGANLPMD